MKGVMSLSPISEVDRPWHTYVTTNQAIYDSEDTRRLTPHLTSQDADDHTAQPIGDARSPISVRISCRQLKSMRLPGTAGVLPFNSTVRINQAKNSQKRINKLIKTDFPQNNRVV